MVKLINESLLIIIHEMSWTIKKDFLTWLCCEGPSMATVLAVSSIRAITSFYMYHAKANSTI